MKRVREQSPGQNSLLLNQTFEGMLPKGTRQKEYVYMHLTIYNNNNSSVCAGQWAKATQKLTENSKPFVKSNL